MSVVLAPCIDEKDGKIFIRSRREGGEIKLRIEALRSISEFKYGRKLVILSKKSSCTRFFFFFFFSYIK